MQIKDSVGLVFGGRAATLRQQRTSLRPSIDPRLPTRKSESVARAPFPGLEGEERKAKTLTLDRETLFERVWARRSFIGPRGEPPHDIAIGST